MCRWCRFTVTELKLDTCYLTPIWLHINCVKYHKRASFYRFNYWKYIYTWTSCTCLYIPAHLLQCLLINALFVYFHLYSSLVTNLWVTILFMLNCMLFIRRKFVSHWLWLHSWKRSQTITTTNEAEQGNGNGEKSIITKAKSTI